MDKGLFAKYLASIARRDNAKQEIISTLHTATGVLLDESDIVLEKKKVNLTVSSVVRTKLITKKAHEPLSLLGYILSL
jgi:cellobiose-specific phosphotransferase system component IIA